MKKFYIIGVLLLMVSGFSYASNVRITTQPFVDAWADPDYDPNAIRNNVAVIQMAVAWDNSWRDDDNWDAVYIFLKCKRTSDLEWTHLWLRDAGHTASTGYSTWMAKNPGGSAHYSTGIFVQRAAKGKGTSEVELELRWQINYNGYTEGDFKNGLIEIEAAAIEMVYVPKGPFVLGDMYSTSSYQKTYRQILPEWDVAPNAAVQVTYYKQDPSMDYVGKNMIDQINDTRTSGNAAYAHAWHSEATGPVQIRFDFGSQPKAIRWIAVEGSANASYRPKSWRIRASNNNQNWTDLGSFGTDDWTVSSTQTYPPIKALKLNNTTTKYRYYMLDVMEATNYSAIRNLAMTEKDLDNLTNDAYVVDGRGNSMTFNNTTGLTERGNLSLSGTLRENFPSGYEGFYAMKYEISQAQYIGFLNKLTFEQQKLRTIGDELENLQKGDYVYAGTDKSKPKNRNGIIVGEKKDIRYIFASNLLKTDVYNSARDGQNIACNFLSPADMLAYASWCGLRPMTELEYEKMSRQGWDPALGYLYTPTHGEYAWGTKTVATPSGDVFVDGTAGGATEQLVDANANVGGLTTGPVRSGSFASGAASRSESGGGYTGVMELSGNLAEIYYAALPANQLLVDKLAAHGNGRLEANGNMSTGMNAVWGNMATVSLPSAFMLRGGSFDQDTKYARTSDRSQQNYFSDINQKELSVTFRLGYSVTYLQSTSDIYYYPKSYLVAQNGNTTQNGNTKDTLCAGLNYTIKGSKLLKSMTGSEQTLDGEPKYVWYIKTESPGIWQMIPGANKQDLTVSKDLLQNNSGFYRIVSFLRVAYTPTQYSETQELQIYIVNSKSFTKDLTGETITRHNHVNGLLVETRFPATFQWYVEQEGMSKKAIKNATNKNNNPFYTTTSSYFTAVRDSFVSSGSAMIYCEALIANRCTHTLSFPLTIESRPATNNSGVMPSVQMTAGNCGEFVRDTRTDAKVVGEIYGTVLIGDQCWMAENLRYTSTESPDIPVKYSELDPSGKTLGALYNWNAKMLSIACPPGWRIPNNTDFDNLQAFLNQDGYNEVGKKMKAGNYWQVSNTELAAYTGRGSNSSGFGAMAAGRDVTTAIRTTGYHITRDNYFYYLSYNNKTLTRSYYASYYWMPIRCILITTSVD